MSFQVDYWTGSFQFHPWTILRTRSGARPDWQYAIGFLAPSASFGEAMVFVGVACDDLHGTRIEAKFDR